jgi:hypothetical protein
MPDVEDEIQAAEKADQEKQQGKAEREARPEHGASIPVLAGVMKRHRIKSVTSYRL